MYSGKVLAICLLLSFSYRYCSVALCGLSVFVLYFSTLSSSRDGDGVTVSGAFVHEVGYKQNCIVFTVYLSYIEVK